MRTDSFSLGSNTAMAEIKHSGLKAILNTPVVSQSPDIRNMSSTDPEPMFFLTVNLNYLASCADIYSKTATEKVRGSNEQAIAILNNSRQVVGQAAVGI